ncbi:MAG: EF2563 family selenium-dependent molybdenum hydroxylase system protein [Candidatus Marinimicrobia bacterium]|nr:EF2563 family selenium-dependent molybdenum hydroxylase system protein [Candidatus Neomarinimicrobiota bacterium]
MNHNSSNLIWIRGAGEIGSAVAISLYNSGFNLVLSEISPPLAIRRSVTFSDAILEGSTDVKGIQAKRIDVSEIDKLQIQSFIPIAQDNPELLRRLNPSIIIDARMIKSYQMDYREWANLVIGYGPGFSTDSNSHVVVETMRGHNLAKLIYNGEPLKNTGVPGKLGGESKNRVIYSKHSGDLEWICSFGDIVEKDQILGHINDTFHIIAPFKGMVRGLIHPSVPLTPGLKIADVDPRDEGIDFHELSDKARSLGRASLEAVLIHLKNQT